MSDGISGGAAASSTAKPADYRLPTDVAPTHYEVAILTDLAKDKFSGEALIHLDVNQDTSNFVFNIHPDLKVTHVAVGSTEAKASAAVNIATSNLSIDKDQERGTLSLKDLPGGGVKAGTKARLFVRWEAELGDNMVGYYRSEAEADENGKKQT